MHNLIATHNTRLELLLELGDKKITTTMTSVELKKDEELITKFLMINSQANLEGDAVYKHVQSLGLEAAKSGFENLRVDMIDCGCYTEVYLIGSRVTTALAKVKKNDEN